MSIPVLLTNYLAAKARDAEAERLFFRAQRTMEKLARRTGGSDAAWVRACDLAGVVLADHRVFAAYHELVRAREALRVAVVAAVRGSPSIVFSSVGSAGP